MTRFALREHWAAQAAGLLAGLVLAPALQAAPAFGFHDGADGVSCRHFDVGLGMEWPGGAAHWVDAKGQRDGAVPYDSQSVDMRGGPAALRWNISALVKLWARGDAPSEGLMVKGPGGTQFHSRESAEVDKRPTLRVSYAGGASELLSPVADAMLDCSTFSGVGNLPYLSTGADKSAILRFDLNKLRKGKPQDIQSAELILLRTAVSAWAAGPLGVYRLSTPFTETSTPTAGLAARFPRDQGIETHPDVLFVDRFESGALDKRWTRGDPSTRLAFDAEGAATPATPARLLRTLVPKGKNLGLDLRYDFKRQAQAEPEEIYMRYYLRLDRSWASAPDAGKLPGMAGTYGKAGWGGRAWDGVLGWSARGAFFKPPMPTHPMHGLVMLGSYLYHSKSSQGFGDTIAWSGGHGAALVLPGRWYAVEQYIKLNKPGAEDGVLRAWVDGHLVFELTQLRWRDTASVKIENAWFDVYLGGHEVATCDMPIDISHVVVARRYIGPMAP